MIYKRPEPMGPTGQHTISQPSLALAMAEKNGAPV